MSMIKLPLALCLLAVPISVSAGGDNENVYRRMNIFNVLGYNDRELDEGTYKVSANAGNTAPGGFARNMALYRASEITFQHGYEYVQVIDAKAKIQITTRGTATSRMEIVEIVIRPSHAPEAPQDCKAKEPRNCVTFSASKIMSVIGPSLGLPK